MSLLHVLFALHIFRREHNPISGIDKLTLTFVQSLPLGWSISQVDSIHAQNVYG